MFGGEEIKELKGQCTGRSSYIDIEITKNIMGIVMEKVTVNQEWGEVMLGRAIGCLKESGRWHHLRLSFKSGCFYGRKWDSGLGPALRSKEDPYPVPGIRDVGEKPATMREDHRGSSVLREEPVKQEGKRDIRKKGIPHLYTEFQRHREELWKKKFIVC